MFDISFAELIVVGIVALVVIGPERLPAVARTVGYFLGRARRYVEQVKRDLNEEMELDDLRKLRDSMHETADSFKNSVRNEINTLQNAVNTPSAIASSSETQAIESEGKDKPENSGTDASSSSQAPQKADN